MDIKHCYMLNGLCLYNICPFDCLKVITDKEMLLYVIFSVDISGFYEIPVTEIQTLCVKPHFTVKSLELRTDLKHVIHSKPILTKLEAILVKVMYFKKQPDTDFIPVKSKQSNLIKSFCLCLFGFF